ncbi:MAG: hypothetical protein AB7G44_07070 [Bacteroidia bacterium]
MSAISEIIKSEIGKRGWNNYSVQAESLNLNSILGIVGKKLVIKTGFALVYKVTTELMQPAAFTPSVNTMVHLKSDTGNKIHHTTNRRLLAADPVGFPVTPWIYETESDILSVHEREIVVDKVDLFTPTAVLLFTNIQVLLVDKR